MLAQGKAKSLSVTCSRLHEDIILADRIISFFFFKIGAKHFSYYVEK